MQLVTDLHIDGAVPDGTQTDEQVRRFRAAMDTSGDAIYLVDRATMRIVDVNQTACARTGYAREELLGMGPQDLMKRRREDLEQDYDEVIAAGEQGVTTETTSHFKDGRTARVELRRRALRTGEGWIIVSIARDITRRKRAERAARQVGRMYAVLSGINEASLRARTPKELYQLVCDAAVFGGRLISASVLVPGPDGLSMEIVAIAGTGQEQLRGARVSVDESIAEGRSLVGIAFRMLQPCVSNDYLNDERTLHWQELARTAGVAAGAAVPVLRGGRAAGVLLFYSQKKDAFDGETVKLLNRMAENVAFALDIFERDAERKRTEEALRESEERFRSLTNLTSDFYWETDTEHRIATVSHAPQHRAVVPKESQTGRARWDMPSTRPDAAGWAAHKATLDAHLPFRNFRLARLGRDGAERHLSITGEPTFDASGGFKGYRGIGRDITERKRVEQRVEHLATHDALTGLPNRVMFGEMLKLAIESARRRERRFAVLFIDLDRFKTVNDRFGHDAGDALLRGIATRLTESLRSSDVVARQGGDEFVALVEEVTDTGEVAEVARKILSCVIEAVSAGGQDCGVTASVGISMYPADGQDERSLMISADRAMYLAKEQGKNRFHFASGSLATPGEPLHAKTP